MIVNVQTDKLYDRDFSLWAEITAKLLEEKRFDEVDLENLVEEVQAFSRSDKREIRSRLIKLLSHLLKYDYQPQKRTDSWISTISEQRRQILLIFEDSPSLQNYYNEVFDSCYDKARIEASQETKLDVDTFPVICPFEKRSILNAK
ncbi:DUF29 domain-containing protein [Pseudanabaena sp. UWO310]|uniref:DUF29 domain-containing protein n=1 Tax=Pseudanabaena sp. UWO310 TaxID=2480795 RepID=UPI00115AE116|nr:DUF29 domain-containing protein [Pseudanabaena sp. UWO310]TYQ27932.1 DUF29 domain-containing protein [Pseudanabaena sp. UWO310]